MVKPNELYCPLQNAPCKGWQCAWFNDNQCVMLTIGRALVEQVIDLQETQHKIIP